MASASIKNKSTRQSYRMYIILAIVFVIIGGVVWLLFSFSNNEAKEVAKPLEDALIKAEAVKKCEKSNPGRGPDDFSPMYESRFELNKSKNETLNIVNSIAKTYGYKLSHSGSPYDSIDWYKDETNKKSSFPSLKEGYVVLSVSLYSNSAQKQLTCDDATILSADLHNTAISLSISLPERK